MKIDYYTTDCGDIPNTVETAGPDQSFPWMKPGIVYTLDGAVDEYGPVEYTPAQARGLAAALLQAADEAEGVKPRITLKDIPEDLPPALARDHMRTHVYLSMSATGRIGIDSGYQRIGYRQFVERDAWYGASAEQEPQPLTR